MKWLTETNWIKLKADELYKTSGWSLNRDNWEALASLISTYSGGSVKFLPAHAATMPTQPGIYVFCLKPNADGPSFLGKLYNVVYVGQTVNLKNRYRQHLAGSTSVVDVMREFPQLEFWYLICAAEDLDYVEKRVYDVLNPVSNRVSPPRIKVRLGNEVPLNP